MLMWIQLLKAAAEEWFGVNKQKGNLSKRESFSRTVKDELASIAVPEEKILQTAEMSAYAYTSGSLYIRDDEVSLHFLSTHSPTARRIFTLWRKMFSTRPELLVRKRIRLDKGNAFLVRITGRKSLSDSLKELGLWRWSQEKDVRLTPSCKFADDESAAKAYLRASFLSGGSISDPRSGYHLEIRPGSLHHAHYIESLMGRLNLTAALMEEKDSPRVYVKDAETISDFLRAVSASKALFKFEDIRILRGMRNRINRLVNSETANMDKVIKAAQEQLADLKVLGPQMLDELSPRTQEFALLRMRYPRSSLRELGEMVEPPVTKSTVEYHFKKIRQLADKARSS